MVYNITVNGKTSFEVVVEENGNKILLNGKIVNPDIVKITDKRWNIINDQNSYVVELVQTGDRKHLRVMVDGRKHTVEIKDRYDDLLKSLGMESMVDDQHFEVRAPMPGMVLEVIAGPGDTVEKGDALLILEAMKMENVIKSPGPGTISRVHAHKGQAVEKNTLLIEFEAIRATK